MPVCACHVRTCPRLQAPGLRAHGASTRYLTSSIRGQAGSICQCTAPSPLHARSPSALHPLRLAAQTLPIPELSVCLLHTEASSPAAPSPTQEIIKLPPHPKPGHCHRNRRSYSLLHMGAARHSSRRGWLSETLWPPPAVG